MRVAKAIVFGLCMTTLAAFGASAAQAQNPSDSASSRKDKNATIEAAASNTLRTYALRLRPDQDLREELEKFTRRSNIRAGFIVTGVGSLKRAALRLADQSETRTFEQKFEIVSLVGTLSTDGVHLHVSLSDKEGKTIGGHLVAGCVIYTTAEIIIGEAQDLLFTREQDAQTGYRELRIRRKGRPLRR